MFSSSGVDAGVKDSPSYRHLPTPCTGVKLDRSALDVHSFRHLVACLNAHHGIHPVEDLLDQLTDSEVSFFLDFGNREIFNNISRLRQIEDSFYALDSTSKLDPLLLNIGKILSNADFFAHAIGLLREAYQKNSYLILKALEKVGQGLDVEGWELGLKGSIVMTSASPFISLMEKFEQPSSSGSLEMARSIQSYLKGIQEPNHFEVGKELLKSFENGSLFTVLDQFMGSHEAELREGIPKFAVVLDTPLQEQGKTFKSLLELFQSLSKPILCMKGGKSISDPMMLIFNELNRIESRSAGDFIQKENLLNLIATQPFCQYPNEIGKNYLALMDLSETSAIQPTVELMQYLYRYGAQKSKEHPLANLFIRMLSEPALKSMVPVFLNLEKRKTFLDIVALLSLPKSEDRKELKKALKYILEPVDRSTNQSLHDVFFNLLAEGGEKRVVGLLSSAGGFLTPGSEAYLSHLNLSVVLKTLLEGVQMSNAHPVLEIFRDFTLYSSSHVGLIELFFKISEKSEFRETLKLFSVMAQDGRLKEVIREMIELFRAFTAHDQTQIQHFSLGEFQPAKHFRHTLSSRNLSEVKARRKPAPADCRALDLSVPIDDYKGDRFNLQLDHFLGCLNTKNQYENVVQAFRFFQHEKTEWGVPFLNFNIDLMHSLNLNRDQAHFLTDRWIRVYDRGEFDRVLNAVPLWVEGGELSVVYPLLSLAKPIIEGAKDALQRTEQYMAQVLRRDDFPSQLQYVDQLFTTSSPPSFEKRAEHFDEDQIKLWVKDKECEAKFSPSHLAKRTQEIIEDYNQSVTSWDLKDGEARRRWELPDFKALVGPIFDKMGDPHQSLLQKTLIEALVQFNRYYTLGSGEFPSREKLETIESLYQWFKVRSSEPRLITYFYPGESKPRVRMINGLERFEVLLINSDVVAPVLGTNFGLRFMAEVGEAWGDEPRELWPIEIEENFRKTGKKPATLAQAVQNIEDTQSFLETMLGFPDLPSCMKVKDPFNIEQAIKNLGSNFLPASFTDLKARLYNIHQVLDVMRENLPHSGTAYEGGLKFFRNLFFQVYYSTPPSYRNDQAGEKNNLSVIGKVAKSGLLHQLSRGLRRFENEDPVAFDALKTWVYASSLPEMKKVLTPLLADDPKHSLLWKIFERIFSVLDERSLRSQDEKRAWDMRIAYLKQLGLYSLASTGALSLEQPTYISLPFVKTLGAVLQNHYNYLLSNTDLLDELFQSENISEFFKTLYENSQISSKQSLGRLVFDSLEDPQRGIDVVDLFYHIDRTSAGRRNRLLLTERWEKVSASAYYRSLHMEEVFRHFLEFFEENDSALESADTAKRLRFYAAEQLTHGGLNQFILLAKNKPNEFYQVFETLSHLIQQGDVKKFFDRVRRSLSDARR